MSESSALYVDSHAYHDFVVKDRHVMLHVPSSGIFDLDGLTGSIVDYLRGKEQVTYDEIRRTFASAPEPGRLAESIEDLKSLGVLSEHFPTRDLGAQVSVTEFPLSTIVINVNTGCNLSCTYCYKEDLTTPAKGEKMDLDKARKSIDLLLAEGAKRDRLNVVFFGGEPLTNMPLIRAVTDYAELRCAAGGKGLDLSLTTNATMLTEEIIDFFDAHRFGISISMDGPQAVHDARRKTIGGKGTYEVVAAKSRMLLERYRSRPVGARVTLTAGYSDVAAIHRHLKDEIGFAEVGFAPVTSNPITTFNLVGDELRAVFDAMKALGREYVAAALENRNIGFSNMHQMLSDLYEGRKKALPCGAGIGLLAVDHEGKLNLCHRFTGSELPTFGDVDSGIDKPRLGEFLDQALDRSERGCSTCRIRNLCSGGCYHESYANFSDPHSPVYHYCELLREWVDFGIEAYLEILEKNPAFLQRHVANRSSEL
ncbi:quinohemoprotein amine dehydrogenase maturation protein [Nitrogeniibacter mangrovi]|uniref:Quinohemoprotein amine dehydrogenase maturation protein n=1 Tax=Nitrogeniibacter mangrovi TaxID=2016596 RepID=A0A6C1B1M9_9RHOO|nr:quinohemoprotein amine dehydrogenase maturation protein [Nitrogeniibacter mangrovi]QID16174.1 quinohemoprotein amine dehydrogenase maturation protein [Nitrogeniibacter mangrovi]